jgi:hypothetical protein
MRMIASKRRSSFGTNCVQCDNELIAPERSEYRDERQIRHFWRCSRCECSFEVISPAPKSIKDIMRRIEEIMRRRDALSSRLVAEGSSMGGFVSAHLADCLCARP